MGNQLISYSLGTVEASEQLIRDLYIELRNKVNAWSEITKQTSQARMGYVGQHLVSVVTGFPGSKSGARGHDLVMTNGAFGEIKTCYRVDQLGKCKKCGAVVSSLETHCSVCNSTNIKRNEDSKCLISLRNEQEFKKVLNPLKYYFVLFEFEKIDNIKTNNIVASIWEVDPKSKGFAYCMIDYFMNIRANSASKAPFNMWPYSLKFAITKPTLIYRSLITGKGDIITSIFPSMNNGYEDVLMPLQNYLNKKTLTIESARTVIHHFDPNTDTSSGDLSVLLDILEAIRQTQNICNSDLCDAFADAIYLPLIAPHIGRIPRQLTVYYPDLQ